MKLNSNTVLLNNDNLQQLLSLSENLAKKNEVFNVKHVDINLNQDKGEIKFSSTLPTDMNIINKKISESMGHEDNTTKENNILHGWENINSNDKEILNHVNETVNK